MYAYRWFWSSALVVASFAALALATTVLLLYSEVNFELTAI